MLTYDTLLRQILNCRTKLTDLFKLIFFCSVVNSVIKILHWLSRMYIYGTLSVMNHTYKQNSDLLSSFEHIQLATDYNSFYDTYFLMKITRASVQRFTLYFLKTEED